MAEYTLNNKSRLFSLFEILIIVFISIVPLFASFPYRINIFLSWEGAYRLSEGEIPFRDFGMPLGYMYWVIPALFFKIFGPQLISLIKAQVLINIISGFAFRSILKSVSVQPGVRLLSVLLYCISFSFFNFWPWYNHTVIVYEMVALAFLMRYLFSDKKQWYLLTLSAVFIFFSFFTKQDGGALGFLICMALLVYHSIREKSWLPVAVFTASFVIVAAVMIVPLLRYNFGYWFNHGQPPHTARISVFDILDEFLYSSQWIKFYLFMAVVLMFAQFRTTRELVNDKRNFVFLLLTLGILAEAAILQVTSYVPPDNNIFFHSFAFAFIFSVFVQKINLDLFRPAVLAGVACLLVLWWSGVFWKYIQGPVRSLLVHENKHETTENVVNRHTYMLTPSDEIPMEDWVYSPLDVFSKVRMPRGTVEGVNRLLNMPLVKSGKHLSVLNMSELTPLATVIPYKPETGKEIPLWYHLGVSMFNKQAHAYEQRIANKVYDLVLFEYIPTLNNFYPFRVRDTLLSTYNKVDSFPAPRRGDTQGIIEIFVKK